MPDPTRPVAGAPIDSAWGQAVHDATFTPRGVRVAGGSSSSVGTTLAQLQLNTATDDPGGWLASDTLTVPAGEGGLYLFALRLSSDNGSVGEVTRYGLKLNGAQLAFAQLDNDGATAVFGALSGIVDLSAGDTLNAWASKSGGLNPDVLVRELSLIRLGTVLGA